MTIKELIKRLTYYKPFNADGLLLCDVAIKSDYSGSYRHTYEIVGMDLIAKLPIRGTCGVTRSCRRHARLEWEGYQRVKTEPHLKRLRKYLPKIYHYEPGTVLILMRKYRVPNNTDKMSDLRAELEEKVQAVLGLKHESPDVDNSGNVAFDRKGRIKIIDLGRFNGY